MTTEQRAGTPSFPQDIKQLRLSIPFAARLSLATLLGLGGIAVVDFAQKLSGNTPKLEAADPGCRISKFAVLGFEYADNPLKANRNGMIDPVDFVVGRTAFREVVIRAQLAEVRGNMVVKDDHAEATFSNFDVEATTKGKDGKPAAELHISFTDDKVRQPDNPSSPPNGVAVVQCGGVGVFWGGSYASESDMRAEAQNAKGINMVGTRIDQITEQIFGKGNKLGVTPAGDNPAQNLKDFKANLDRMIEHAKQVRAEEAKKAATSTLTLTPTVTITPTAKETATSTLTPTAKETATPTLTKTSTPDAKATEAAQAGAIGTAVEATVQAKAKTPVPTPGGPLSAGFSFPGELWQYLVGVMFLVIAGGQRAMRGKWLW